MTEFVNKECVNAVSKEIKCYFLNIFIIYVELVETPVTEFVNNESVSAEYEEMKCRFLNVFIIYVALAETLMRSWINKLTGNLKQLKSTHNTICIA